MKTSAFLTILLALALAALTAIEQASASSKCFEQHLRESMQINRTMKDFYNQIGKGDVHKLYNLLISAEHLSVPTAKYYDFKVRSFQKQGIDLLCREFVPMSLKTPELTSPLKENYREFDWKKFKRPIVAAIKSGKTKEVRATSLTALIELEKRPQYHCLTRHMLESIYRFAHFADIREKQAEKVGIRSPKKILFHIMKLHSFSLMLADQIDDMAAPIQKNGVPVLCNELPDILKDLNNPELSKLNRK